MLFLSAISPLKLLIVYAIYVALQYHFGCVQKSEVRYAWIYYELSCKYGRIVYCDSLELSLSMSFCTDCTPIGENFLLHTYMLYMAIANIRVEGIGHSVFHNKTPCED